MPKIIKLTEDFAEKFYDLVKQIPRGKITTYGILANALGDKRAARAVGQMLNQNPNLEEVPCHRVVRSNGELGGYVKGKSRKKELLNKENIEINNNKIKNFETRIYDKFETSHPLKKLREYQLKTKEKIILKNKYNNIRYIGGIDASYKNNKIYVVLYILDKEKNEEHIIKHSEQIPFPYIPTYLAFRETPAFLKTIKKSKIKPDIILVDGNGILHPKEIGQASQLGVETHIPTIGVAKSLLCGKLENKVTQQKPISKVLKDQKLIGYAYLSSSRAKNPIYISPGHKITSKSSLQIVKKFCNYKIPKPIRKAHILSGKYRDRN